MSKLISSVDVIERLCFQFMLFFVALCYFLASAGSYPTQVYVHCVVGRLHPLSQCPPHRLVAWLYVNTTVTVLTDV
jgi:hypothetical protein